MEVTCVFVLSIESTLEHAPCLVRWVIPLLGWIKINVDISSLKFWCQFFIP